MPSLDHLNQIITQLWPSIGFVGKDDDGGLGCGRDDYD